jgi:hypothetical protein
MHPVEMEQSKDPKQYVVDTPKGPVYIWADDIHVTPDDGLVFLRRHGYYKDVPCEATAGWWLWRKKTVRVEKMFVAKYDTVAQFKPDEWRHFFEVDDLYGGIDPSEITKGE